MYYLIPLGYNWIVPEKPGGTEARCDALLKFCDKHYIDYEDCVFILTADRPPESNHRPMAEEMADYIRDQSLGLLSPTSQPMGWGTVAEIKNSVDIIRKDKNNKGEVKVIISTNLGHIPRVWLCWMALRPKGWKVIFVPSNQSFTKKEWRQETRKFFGTLYLIVTGKIKRTAT